MSGLRFCAKACLATVALWPLSGRAGTITYLATSNQLPHQQGWTFATTGGGPSSLSASSGIMTMVTGVTPRANWSYNLLNASNPAGSDLFMESTVRVVNESHTRGDRGIGIFGVERITSGSTGTSNLIDGYAWSDRIFWTNSDDQVVGQVMLNTSAFHNYRVELDGDNGFIYVDGVLVGSVLNNSRPHGNASQPDVLRSFFGDGSSGSGSWTEWRSVSAGALSDSITQTRPILPSPQPGGGTGGASPFVFNNVPTGRWIDPPMANGYTYTMTSANLFTSIGDFPVGFSSPFTVTAEGQSWLGSPGNAVDFVGLLGHGVSTFSISGISPLVDSADPSAFPLLLNFNAETASFTMTPHPVPEPASLTLLGSGALGLLGCQRRRRSLCACAAS